MKKSFVLFLWAAVWVFGESLFFASRLSAEEGYRVLSRLPVQSGGRVKPFSSLARETVREVTGKERWEGRPPMQTLLDWVAQSEAWEKKVFLRLDAPLRKLTPEFQEKKFASPSEVRGAEWLFSLAKTASAKTQAEEKKTPEEEAALVLVGRLHLFDSAASGHLFTMLPLEEKWISFGELWEAYSKDKQKAPPGVEKILMTFAQVVKAHLEGDQVALDEAARRLKDIQETLAQGKKAFDARKLALEDHYNRLHPFRWAWAANFLALAAFIFNGLFKRRAMKAAAVFLFGTGLFVSAYGFALRCYLAGRPPVTNMYESLIWVAFGAAFFAAVFAWVMKNISFLPWAAAASFFGFLLADFLPGVLDPDIEPLVPVLRSNYWLIVHVLTITLSYAAFTLAFFLAHEALFRLWRGKSALEIQDAVQRTYRVVQVGVVLLAAGTILGGVWANASWGRFWGWDPKETWALIALLGYVAVLHGRLAGWLREFGFIAGVAGAYLGVLMAWYGVNFVLGTGLHSYGFTSGGGLPWVLTFVVLDAALFSAVAWRLRIKKAT